jgi:hypothetical protein
MKVNIKDMSNEELRDLNAQRSALANELFETLDAMRDQIDMNLDRLSALLEIDRGKLESMIYKNSYRQQADEIVNEHDEKAAGGGGNLFIDGGTRLSTGKIQYSVLDDSDNQIATLTGRGRAWDVYVGKKKVASGSSKQRAIDAFVEALA